MDVKPGDKVLNPIQLMDLQGQVLLPAYGGNNLKLGDEEYTLYKSSEILAIINESSQNKVRKMCILVEGYHEAF